MTHAELHARLMRQIDVAYPISHFGPEKNEWLKSDWIAGGALFEEALKLYDDNLVQAQAGGLTLWRGTADERALAAWLSDVGHDQDNDVYHRDT